MARSLFGKGRLQRAQALDPSLKKSSLLLKYISTRSRSQSLASSSAMVEGIEKPGIQVIVLVRGSVFHLPQPAVGGGAVVDTGAWRFFAGLVSCHLDWILFMHFFAIVR